MALEHVGEPGADRGVCARRGDADPPAVQCRGRRTVARSFDDSVNP